MLEQIEDRLVQEYTKLAAMPSFRASVDLAKRFLRIEDVPLQAPPPKKKVPKAKRKPASLKKKSAKHPKAKK